MTKPVINAGSRLDMSKVELRIIWENNRKPRCDRAYFDWCQTQQIPYLRISMLRDRGDVLMSFPGCPHPLDAKIKEELSALQKHYHRRVQTYETCEILMEDLLPDVAFRVADWLLVIALRFHHRFANKGRDPQIVSLAVKQVKIAKAKPENLKIFDCAVKLENGQFYRLNNYISFAPPEIEAVQEEFFRAPYNFRRVSPLLAPD